MKNYSNIIIIALVVIIFATIAIGAMPTTTTVKAEANTEPRARLYPTTAVVVELDRENDIVTCADYAGNLWEFEGCEDWETGDVASLLMCDLGTASIYDDTIEMVRYSGHIGD